MLRLIGGLLVATSIVMAAYDMFGAPGRLRALAEWWLALHPGSLQMLEPAITRYVDADFWYVAVIPVLQLPGAAIVGAMGLLLVLLGLFRKALAGYSKF